MSMSRKEYQAIADVLKAMHKNKMTTREKSLMYGLTIALAQTFGAMDPSFRRNKFILAAEGVEE